MPEENRKPTLNSLIWRGVQSMDTNSSSPRQMVNTPSSVTESTARSLLPSHTLNISNSMVIESQVFPPDSG